MLQIKSMLEGLTNNISKMATIVEVLKSNIPYFYWVGFYLSDKDRLSIGPYQGTHGCIFIDYNKGVCGRVASQRKTIIVDDIQALNDKQGASKGELHISCDARSQSEIALPVVAKNGNLIAVFDVDSLSKKAFATIDQEYLEMILKEHF
ncbi:MAG: hypothetical protein AUJ98_09120 [Bacteroidetes bacterium CG2_30_33_31]|nr:MAG: hypothetical protein AUJ98_09120 [Bacteroidetes bacterium CG2_30_33_31]